MEVLMKSDLRNTFQKCQEAIKIELDGLLARKDFAFVPSNKIPPNTNILGGHIILEIKNPKTGNGTYKARFVFHGNKT